MIKQYNITLRTAKGETLPPYSAYWLYSKLVESVTPEFANYLHKPTYTPLSQYVLRSTYNQEVQWIVNLLEDRAKAEISPILDSWNQSTKELVEKQMNATLSIRFKMNCFDRLILRIVGYPSQMSMALSTRFIHPCKYLPYTSGWVSVR